MARRLVAVALAGGPAFVAALTQAWEAGDAVLPVDLRLPATARQDLLARMRPDRLICEEGVTTLVGGVPVGDDDALVIATSGSTGAPKGAVITHGAVAASARLGTAAIGAAPATDTWLACLPLAHVAALGVVTKALITSTRLVVHDGFDAAAAEQVATEAPTLTTLVPTAYARVRPEAFKAIVIGGAAVPSRLASNTVWSYGLSETFGGCAYDGVPFPEVDLRIDEQSQILVRSPTLLRCYRDGTTEHDPRAEGGWFPTDDAGEIVRGRLRVLGRRSELIITGGENVWPAVVEDALRAVPGVAEVAVMGRPDPEWGERVTAIVVPTDPTSPPSLDEIRDHVKERLPLFCAPKALELAARLPHTPSGKIDRRRLR